MITHLYNAPSREDFANLRRMCVPFSMPMRACKALQWSPEYFRQTVSDHMVEVTGERDTNPEYDPDCESHKRDISFYEYLDWIAANPYSNDIYINANNHFLEKEGGVLVEELPIDENYVTGYIPGSAFLWFGSGNSVTKLHYDNPDILFCQLYGQKRWIFYRPDDGKNLYQARGVHSAFDPLDPDYERFPLARDAMPYEALLGPGVALYVPNGWWHCVQSMGASVSVSFTNLQG